MGICPLCNHLREVVVACPQCGENMRNEGREADYYDDYSPYLETDIQKQTDGISQSVENGICQHLLSCNQCGIDIVISINETDI